MKNMIITMCLSVLGLAPLLLPAQNCNEANSIVSIRNKPTGDTEELIFTLKQPTDPDLSHNAIKPPFTDYGGDKVHVKGTVFREIHFKNVYWMCKPKNYTSFASSLISDIKETERFEGYITYVVGLNKGVKLDKQYTIDRTNYKKIIFRFKK